MEILSAGSADIGWDESTIRQLANTVKVLSANRIRIYLRSLFQHLGWLLHAGSNGVCDTVTKDQQDLYMHPTCFSGVMDEANIQSLQEQFSKCKTFRCYAVDCYKEYTELNDEEYRAELETRRGEITAFILEQCRTKQSNLYIIDPIALYFAEYFEICRICDKDRHNAVGILYV